MSTEHAPLEAGQEKLRFTQAAAQAFEIAFSYPTASASETSAAPHPATQTPSVEKAQEMLHDQGGLEGHINRYGGDPSRCPFLSELGTAGMQLMQKFEAAKDSPTRGRTVAEILAEKRAARATAQPVSPVTPAETPEPKSAKRATATEALPNPTHAEQSDAPQAEVAPQPSFARDTAAQPIETLPPKLDEPPAVPQRSSAIEQPSTDELSQDSGPAANVSSAHDSEHYEAGREAALLLAEPPFQQKFIPPAAKSQQPPERMPKISPITIAQPQALRLNHQAVPMSAEEMPADPYEHTRTDKDEIAVAHHITHEASELTGTDDEVSILMADILPTITEAAPEQAHTYTEAPMSRADSLTMASGYTPGLNEYIQPDDSFITPYASPDLRKTEPPIALTASEQTEGHTVSPELPDTYAAKAQSVPTDAENVVYTDTDTSATEMFNTTAHHETSGIVDESLNSEPVADTITGINIAGNSKTSTQEPPTEEHAKLQSNTDTSADTAPHDAFGWLHTAFSQSSEQEDATSITTPSTDRGTHEYKLRLQGRLYASTAHIINGHGQRLLELGRYVVRNFHVTGITLQVAEAGR